ncbi:tetratricopeptide repeat protein [Nevskia sp.]|uniref:adenylate/guanylate cyclase domain-containing protein n=1 Tax=Nevskia sp. TaxID=1929292 RepID=UPI0025D6C0D2|nr:tetratricopeptide repeat protein [Nevskia sp.]
MKASKRQPSRRLAAIVFTDIVNYSAFVHRDERLGERLLNRQKAVVRSLYPRFGGIEIKTAGDSFLLEFGSALAAVQAVIAIQRGLAAANAEARDDPPVLLRASIHLGDVEHRERDVYGDGVNIAARLLPLSPQGGLALSSAVLGLVRQRHALAWRSIGTPALKNISHPVEVFVVDAESLQTAEAAAAAVPDTQLPQRGRRLWAIGLSAAAVIALLIAALAIWKSAVPAPIADLTPALSIPNRPLAAERASIAVLPLINQSGEDSGDYFSDGLTEEMITALAQVRELRVIGRNSAFQFKGRPADARVIGELLKVGHLLEGSVRRQGTKVRIIARLVTVADGSQLWSASFDRELKDIFAVQVDIAQAVATQLKLQLIDREPHSASRAADLDAYNALLLGNYFYELNDHDSWRKAIDYYRQATVLDPAYALAWAKLATTATHMAGNYMAGEEAREAFRMARSAAEKALSIDPGLAEGHAALGWLLMIADLDLLSAERELRRAVELAPTEAGPKHRLAYVLGGLGRLDEAVSLIRSAFLFDPLGFRGWYYLGLFQTAQGRYDDAETALRKALELQPTAATQYQQLAMIKLMRGKPDLALLDALREPDPYWREYAVALARQRLGDPSAADAALRAFTEAHTEDGAFQIATLHALRGEAALAFEWLAKAQEMRDPATTGLRMDPFFARYRDDPRYAAFCKIAGLITL